MALSPATYSVIVEYEQEPLAHCDTSTCPYNACQKSPEGFQKALMSYTTPHSHSKRSHLKKDTNGTHKISSSQRQRPKKTPQFKKTLYFALKAVLLCWPVGTHRKNHARACCKSIPRSQAPLHKLPALFQCFPSCAGVDTGACSASAWPSLSASQEWFGKTN